MTLHRPAVTVNFRYVYIVAVLSITTVGVIAAIIIMVLRPDKDNTMLIATIFGFLLPTTTSLLAFLKAEETRESVNGLVTEYMTDKTKIAKLEAQKKD